MDSPARGFDLDLDDVIFWGGWFCLQSLAHMMETVQISAVAFAQPLPKGIEQYCRNKVGQAKA
jgi:hypothetical protein